MSAVDSIITLDAVRINSLEIVDAVRPMYRKAEPIRAVAADELHIRHMIEGWGKTCRVELRCPATWWQHVKLTLRRRWPRLFWRLAVRYDIAIAENGAIVADLGSHLGAHHRVIPYRLPTTEYSTTDEPSTYEYE